MEKTNIRKVQIIIGIIIIAMVNLWNLGSLYSITIINDEFGYVGLAAQMAGYDWKNLLGTSMYYSYGYGIILSLLFRAGLTATAFFRAAVLLNVLFLIFAFLIICYFAEKFINSKYDILIALAIALYSSNIFQTRLSWTESILYFLAWLFLYFIYQLGLRFQLRYLFALIFTAVYMYTVHQRCLSAIIAAIIMSGIILINGHLNKKNVCKMVAAILFLIFLLVIARAVKDWIIANWYLADSVLERRIAANDYGGQIGKIARLTDPKALVSTFLGMVGKLWAQAAASGMLILIALIVVIWRTLQRGILRLEIEDVFSIAAVLLFLGALGIAMLYYSNYLSVCNYYAIIMTRYIDYTAGPMLLLGFKIMFDYKHYTKEIIMSIGIMVIITLSTYFAFTRSYRPLMINVNIPSIYPLIGNLSGGLQRILVVGMGAIIFALIVMGIIQTGINKGRADLLIFAVLSGMIFMWSYNGLKLSVGFTNNKQEEVKDYVLPVVDYIEDIEYNKTVYYIAGEDEQTNGRYNFLKILQFMLPEQRIELIEGSDIGNISENNGVLILVNSERTKEFDLSGIEEGFLIDTGRLRVYMLEDSN